MSDLELFPSTSSLSPSPSSSPPQCDYSEWSPTWVLIPSVYLLAFLLGSLGNGLVLWAYLDRPRSSQVLGSTPCSCTKRLFHSGGAGSTPKLPGSSRSLTDSLIASLAVADLAFLITLPLWAAYTALDYHWPFGQPLCRVSSYLVALNMYASVFSLTALSVERYWLIAGHRRSSRTQRRGTCRVLWVVGNVWLFAGVLALPALLLRTVREVELGEEPDDYWQEVEEGEMEGDQVDGHRTVIFSCAMDYSSLISDRLGRDERERAELLWTAALGLKSTLIGFLLPLAVLLVCYCSLGHLVSRHFKHGPRPDPQRQRRLLRVIVTLVMAFFLCWLPFHTNKSLSMLVELGLVPYSCLLDRTLLAAHPYATCLGYLNSCLNPLLYACCDPAFRQRCRALLPWGGAGRDSRQGGWRGCRGGCDSPQAADKEEEGVEGEEDREQPSRTREESVDGVEEDNVQEIRHS